MDEGTVATLEALVRSGRLTEARLDAVLDVAGLSVAKWWALRHLSRSGVPLPLSKLAALLDCARSNATQLVDRLEAEGLVRRIPDPEDRRGVLAEMTDEGHDRYRKGLEALSRVEHTLERLYSPRERSQLVRLLERLDSAWG